MKPKKTFYVWKCSHCEHRNKEVFNMHWDFSMSYTANWSCSRCGGENLIKFSFRAFPITEKRGEEYYKRWY